VFGWLKRHWWRFVGLACVLTAVGFSFHGNDIDRRWAERMEDKEARWRELAGKVNEKAEEAEKVRGLAAQNRLAAEMLNLVTQQILLHNQDLRETQALYDEKVTNDTYIKLLNGTAACVFSLGMWLDRRAARRRARDADRDDEHDPLR
jgi:hypothetical protein